MKWQWWGLAIEKAGCFYGGGLFWFSAVRQGDSLNRITIAWLTRWPVRASAYWNTNGYLVGRLRF
jgi:hypothetical protein